MGDVRQNLSDIRSDLADFALLVDEIEHENFKLKNENAGLKAKLAKAVEVLREIKSDMEDNDYSGAYLECKYTLMELTGEPK